jgi:hypothetical protein
MVNFSEVKTKVLPAQKHRQPASKGRSLRTESGKIHCHDNLSIRLFNRRFTRLTLRYSKKLANLCHSVALLIAHFNFCRVHSAHSQTLAQACGLTDHAWTVEELLRA